MGLQREVVQEATGAFAAFATTGGEFKSVNEAPPIWLPAQTACDGGPRPTVFVLSQALVFQQRIVSTWRSPGRDLTEALSDCRVQRLTRSDCRVFKPAAPSTEYRYSLGKTIDETIRHNQIAEPQGGEEHLAEAAGMKHDIGPIEAFQRRQWPPGIVIFAVVIVFA
jgi:hypothetical protein